MDDILTSWFVHLGASAKTAVLLERLAAFGLLLLIIGVTSWLSKQLLVPLLERAVRRSNTPIDDIFITRGFFHRLSRLLPIAVFYASIDLMFPVRGAVAELIRRLAMILFVMIGTWVLDAVLLAFYDILRDRPVFRDKPVRGYIEAAKIFLYILAAVFAISILTDKSPWGVLSVFGGLTAVLLLIFKDTILGFVANLRLSSNDMVRVGDWIEMPKYDADGDVIDISIHTIKVRNWDKTITNIPTYVLISDHFKNWRGMQETGGRRIKRALYLDMGSIKFCTPEMLERFSRIALISNYIRRKQEEIDDANREHSTDLSLMVNGRRQTNIGVFRAYCIAYLKAHPKIHQELTFLVRQLAPTPQGLPLEIYVFTNDVAWANYEAIQADIFDHLLAAVPQFDLRLFQYPNGHDFQSQIRVRAFDGPRAAAARAGGFGE